ncbi:hypothetical protein DWY69_02205 [Eisenbergiella massiliensis]|uniref:Uncharacterized protein n=1 Tax=Eisenbergiella massiliensis TaxID=1720294 RepID=A0A3E3J3N5_9FIRM|nr:hypothetical protein DWY69_02205 [Eisenbergiella massiliensis]
MAVEADFYAVADQFVTVRALLHILPFCARCTCRLVSVCIITGIMQIYKFSIRMAGGTVMLRAYDAIK